MTREEWKLKSMNYCGRAIEQSGAYFLSDTQVHKLIDDMCDYFKQRTCESCKYFNIAKPQLTKKGYCEKFLRHEHGTFGCNQWSQRSREEK